MSIFIQIIHDFVIAIVWLL